MLQSSVQDCMGVDEFRFAQQSGVREVHVASGNAFTARVTKIDLPHLWLQSINTQHPFFLRVETQDRIRFAFSDPEDAPLKHQGYELAPSEISLQGPGGLLWSATTGPGTHRTLSLPRERLLALGPVLIGRDIVPAAPVMIARAAPASLNRLRALHEEATSLAARVPRTLSQPEAAFGLEAALSEAMIDCLAGSDVQPERDARRRSAKIIRRLGELEEANHDRPLYMAEVCSVLGVGQRTLHHICSETLGMGPKQYLFLRRLRFAHEALRRADPGRTTVTHVAMQYGFWELGRFAGVYRKEFGQSPSVTLRREYDEAHHPDTPAGSKVFAHFGP